MTLTSTQVFSRLAKDFRIQSNEKEHVRQVGRQLPVITEETKSGMFRMFVRLWQPGGCGKTSATGGDTTIPLRFLLILMLQKHPGQLGTSQRLRTSR